METLPFKPYMPGIRTLWVIKFRENFPLPENITLPKPPVDFFIPSPFEKNEWICTNRQANKKAIECLEKIQDKCVDIKKEYTTTTEKPLETLDDYLNKAKDLFKNLENLDDLMKDYNKYLKKIFPNTPSSEKPDEKQEEKPPKPEE